jgi:hypothetical protein
MERIDFSVQGSSSEPYRVSLIRDEGATLMVCTCEAGINGMHCKHRVRILLGSSEDVIDPITDDIKAAAIWIKGTPIESALLDCERLDAEAEDVKRRLKPAKKRLAASLMGKP